jgi:tetratricopeptide (TPR) repeat protein
MEGLQPDFLHSFGSALGEVGVSDGALALLTRALSLGDRSASLFANLGALYLTRRDYKDAVAILDEGLKMWTDHPILLHNLALAYARGGLARRAVQIYGRLLQVAPWDDGARLDLAAALLMDGDHDRARMVLQDYLRRVPRDRRPPEVEELTRRLLPEDSGG